MLEEQGYRTNAGRKFSATTINAMLKNDKYYGTLVYNRIGGKRKKNRVLIENFDEIRTQDAIPAIISKDLFDKVQTIMRENSNKAKQYSHPEYVLTGLLVCKSCGKNMHGSTQHISKTKDKYRTYACPNHSSKSGSTCKTKNIRAEYIETAIKDMIANSINDYINTSGSAQVYASMSKDISSEICKLKQRIAELDKKVSALLVKAASTTSALLAQRYEEEAELMLETKAKKESQIADLQNSCTAMQSLLQDTNKATLTVEDIFTSADITRDLFRLYIDKIEIDDVNDDISIVFK
ncbi:MAG: recombinase family protein [Clostridia bacterium]|nr:recombinase family protein [Clostridia bacterium]